MNVLAFRVLGRGELRLDSECVCAEVVTLCLEQVGRQILGPVTVKPRQSGREGRCRDAEKGSLGHDVSPAGLRLVDGLVEEIIEEQVLEVRVRAVSLGDVLQEDGADDASTAPHEGNLGLVELPAVLLGGLLRNGCQQSYLFDKQSRAPEGYIPPASA